MKFVSPGHLWRQLAGLLLTVLAVSVSLAAQSSSRSYRIGPNDEIAIQVLEDESLNVARRVSAKYWSRRAARLVFCLLLDSAFAR